MITILIKEVSNMEIGHIFLMRERSKKGLSQRALAEISGVSQPSIARLETGQYVPGIDTLLKLLKALGVPMTAYLKVIGYEEPKRGKVAVQGIEPCTTH
jgi:transcriptional regulator with XRE-family HTH domain